MSGGYELLEHTADVGIHAWGDSPAAAFEQAAWGLVDVLGVRLSPDMPGWSIRHPLRASAEDLGGVLVDLLNELVRLHETEEVGFVAIHVSRVTETRAAAEAEVLPLPGEPDGIAVKAATYHQLEVRASEGGGLDVQVFLDV